jgi:hypothetical protein
MRRAAAKTTSQNYMTSAANGTNKGSSEQPRKPIAIYYEHPDWFRPLFQQLDERGVAWVKIHARDHRYDVASPENEYSLLFNRMSPSAWQRGLGHCIWRISKKKACAWSMAIAASRTKSPKPSSWPILKHSACPIPRPS